MKVIPKVKEIKITNGVFKHELLKSYSINEKFNDSKNFIKLIFSIINRDLEEVEKGAGSINFKLDSKKEDEEYEIDILESRIDVYINSNSGLVYALQTLRLLFEFDLEVKDVECQTIKDKPDFKWRGLLLDEARHFFGKDIVFRLLDTMSLLKLNVLHWHLTDNEGWRVELDSYPNLIKIGSKREDTQICGWHSLKLEGKPHEGYYSKKDIKEIISYAKERAINILPEIDMPGHFAAANAAYSELACRNIKVKVPPYFGPNYPRKTKELDLSSRPLCIGNENSINFAKKVVEEVCQMFEFPYFHIGGDEVPTTQWKLCPKCQELMKEKGFKKERQLQSYFIDQIREVVEKNNKKLIGWNEILKGDKLNKNVIAQYWTPLIDLKVKKFVKSGGEVIISKHQHFYFDMPYALVPSKNTYKFSLSNLGLNKYKKNIKGFEGTLWSEWIPNEDRLNFMSHPRLECLSETAWSEQKDDINVFNLKFAEFSKILDKHKIIYAKDFVANPKENVFAIRKAWFAGQKNIETDNNK